MNSPADFTPRLTSAASSEVGTSLTIPAIYHVHPLVAGPLRLWPALFDHVARMGFTHICVAPPFEPSSSGDIFVHFDFERLHPALQFTGNADRGLAQISDAAAKAGLKLMLDIAPAQISPEALLCKSHPDWFGSPVGHQVPDPRHPPERTDTISVRLDQTDIAEAQSEWWQATLGRFAASGVSGFRCLTLDKTPPSFWRRVIAGCRESTFLAWTPGVPREALAGFAHCGFDFSCTSAGWWDGGAEWLFDELGVLPYLATPLSSPEPSFSQRLAQRLPHDVDPAVAYRLALNIAVVTGSGLFLPMGFEYGTRRAFDPARASPEDFEAARREAVFDLSEDIRQSVHTAGRLPPLQGVRTISPGNASLTAFLRTQAADVRDSHEAALVLINPDLRRPMDVGLSLAPLPPEAGASWTVKAKEPRVLQPGEVRVLACHRNDTIESGGFDLQRRWAEASRIVVEDVQPTVPGGDFPAKTVVGRSVTISADVFADGHDILGAEALWRPADEVEWRRARMVKGDNDRWTADVHPDRVGLHQFAVEGWWDQWASYAHDLHAKVAAGQVVKLEIQEGRALIEQASFRVSGDLQTTLKTHLAGATDADALLSADLDHAMQQADHHPLASRSSVYQLRVDRPAAEFASWYELFPRSETADARVHGTFRSVVDRLPAIRAMGFDVLYFPPIHPIGRINRKGKNNSLRAEDGDVGSPYAIGGVEGGHDAVHPALGSLADFQALQQAAHDNGLELAIDFAIQCAPDHPWISQHKDWFRWRPDGSMRYAENPPKKYEDIVNPDFWSDASFPAVWHALRDVIRFWVDQGIRIFRVDNPHTKPLPFWQWMIADIQGTHPDVLFLSEAFTRPKLMYRLAKIGFTQSYTYFTWRTTKQEITEYLTEITKPPVADFFRPNFFVNTPDINPIFLQNSGRPGFLIRAALAATLSGLWGVYSGFEICESEPLPGREEYLDSEKYEIRPRNYQAPGNIVAEITALNRIRRRHPALQSHLGLQFYLAWNDQVILYGKPDPDGSGIILVAVSLDPHHVQEADIEVPVWEFGLPDNADVAVEELMRGYNFVWHGKYQHIRLDPFDTPFYIWRLSRVGAN